MPKIKTNRAAAKRFRHTGGSKVKRAKAFRRHILTSKPRKRKRNLRQGGYVAGTDMREIARLMPNG